MPLNSKEPKDYIFLTLQINQGLIKIKQNAGFHPQIKSAVDVGWRVDLSLGC